MDKLTIEQCEKKATEIWRHTSERNTYLQLAAALRDLNGILENVPEAAEYYREKQQWYKDSDNG